ncbi:AEC family transporter [Propylenella binzhouense]|uniref:AEC family transporter n=1 Tax=Propylenella binzhouense TaxID=2555902 RepID=A0A964WS84_9HYPH|nr:AEC family transporter [Propylenella binzhouense]MYZ46687.1 AEC family transporter [Propylenella binzhouense]
MIAALQALLPILIVTAVGWVLARSEIVTPAGWIGFEAVTYHVFFPSIVVLNLAEADFGALPFATLGASLAASVLTMTALCFGLKRWFSGPLRLDGPRFTSVLQGATRWNTFIALAMAASLYGPEGVALTAVAIVAMIPLLNFINVSALSAYASGAPLSARRFARDLALNPYIWSSALGVAINLVGLELPVAVSAALRMMGEAALAAGILAVGAGLDLSSLRRPGPALTMSSVLRLAGMPLLAALYCRLFDVGGTALGVAIVATAVPTASGAYLLARRMGGDARLMAEIITLQTVLCAVTLPMAMAVLA